MGKQNSALESSVWTDGDITITTSPADFYGIVIDATAGAVTIKDDGTTKIVFTPSVELRQLMVHPIAFGTNITATNAGTGNYTVMFRDRG